VDNGTILFSGPRIKGYMIKQGREIKGSETCDECKWELVGSFQGNMGKEDEQERAQGRNILASEEEWIAFVQASRPLDESHVKNF
jgi:hypothetical protein